MIQNFLYSVGTAVSPLISLRNLVTNVLLSISFVGGGGWVMMVLDHGRGVLSVLYPEIHRVGWVMGWGGVYWVMVGVGCGGS